MVKVGLLRINNPWINLAVAVVLFLIALIFTSITNQARIVIVLAGLVLIARAAVSLFNQSRQKESRADRFARFAAEEKTSTPNEE